MNIIKLQRFLDKKKRLAQRLCDKAEKDREKSNYTDIDALEQSCFNYGQLDLINEIQNLISE